MVDSIKNTNNSFNIRINSIFDENGNDFKNTVSTTIKNIISNGKFGEKILKSKKQIVIKD